MRITATPQAADLVSTAGGRLYVWSLRSGGCQPLRRLEVASEPPRGRTFDRADFDLFDLYLAEDGCWPDELGVEVCRGRLRALWDGAAWAV